ncbi:homeodomain transcription factor [Mycena floridula]|nr:homeodomain transcription factor [Mycena floridula]
MPQDSIAQLKRPRHRHSPAQLNALNELYILDQTPSLHLRTSLGDRIGMETKTVNAWFQNKRASTKKRPTVPSGFPYETASCSDEARDDYDNDELNLRSWYAGISEPDPRVAGENDSEMPRKVRNRPSSQQHKELQRLFSLEPHPSAEQRQALADRIGMRQQAVNNWFQHQRSLARRRERETSADARIFSSFPPPTGHPSLEVQLGSLSQRHRSPSVASSLAEDSYLRPRRTTTPYGTTAPKRAKRSRPEPYQLDALKALYRRTGGTPTIEQRQILADQVGMDVKKVCNWCRNTRQSERRRLKKAESGDEHDEDIHTGYPSARVNSLSASRSGSPSLRSSPSSSEYYDEGNVHGGAHSSDEDQEAVTPESSPPPRNMQGVKMEAMDPSFYSKALIADAQLLLNFHRHTRTVH